MSLRWKIALAMAALASVASIAFGAASYRTTSDRLYAAIDESLLNVDNVIGVGRPEFDRLPARGPLAAYDVQFIDTNGNVTATTFDEPLPVNDAGLTAIGDPRRNTFSTVEGSNGSYRVRTIGLSRGAIQVTRSLDETERVLTSLRNRTFLLTVLVAAAATAAGWWLAGRVTASLRKFTAAAEHVAETGQLDVEVGESGKDEVGRLGSAFDDMLAALSRSREEQRRLVQDAGHELRTPLTSVRTNLDILRRFPDLPADSRDEVIADLHAETEELTDLVNEIVAVAGGAAADEPITEFDLARLATEVADRFERRTGRAIVVGGDASVVSAQRSGVHRALSCLIDNACKFDDGGGRIDVAVDREVVTVSDRGPGIAEGELDHVFERFHRADEARTMSGSGLGLSIVREVAVRHGGDVFARNREGGGAEIGFSLTRSIS